MPWGPLLSRLRHGRAVTRAPNCGPADSAPDSKVLRRRKPFRPGERHPFAPTPLFGHEPLVDRARKQSAGAPAPATLHPVATLETGPIALSRLLFDEIIALRMAAASLPAGSSRTRIDARLDRIAGLALIGDMEESGDIPAERAAAERRRIAGESPLACEAADESSGLFADPRLDGLERRIAAIEAALGAGPERPQQPGRPRLRLIRGTPGNPVGDVQARLAAELNGVPLTAAPPRGPRRPH